LQQSEIVSIVLDSNFSFAVRPTWL